MNHQIIKVSEMQYRMEKYCRAAKMYNRLAWKCKKRGEHFGHWIRLRQQNIKFARHWQKDLKEMLA